MCVLTPSHLLWFALSDFMVYETLKSWLPHSPWARTEDDEPRQHALLGCGATAGVVGQTVAYPLDLVRRRLQVQGWSKETHYQYTGGILRTMRQIVAEEGIRGLYRGMVPNYYKGRPHTHVLYAQHVRLHCSRTVCAVAHLSCVGVCVCSGARCVDLIRRVRGDEEMAGYARHRQWHLAAALH